MYKYIAVVHGQPTWSGVIGATTQHASQNTITLQVSGCIITSVNMSSSTYKDWYYVSQSGINTSTVYYYWRDTNGNPRAMSGQRFTITQTCKHGITYSQNVMTSGGSFIAN